MSKVVRPNFRQWQVAETSRFLENWPSAGRPADFDIRYGLKTIKARSRLEAQNNDHVRGFLNLVQANVVGRAGVVFQSRARLAGGKPDKKLQQQVEEAWGEWCRLGQCDVTGMFSWPMLQRQAMRTVARDGEAIFRIAQGFDNAFGFALQEIDPDCLDILLNQSRDKGRNEIRMGVEFDQWRRPIAYWLTEEPGINSGGYGNTSSRERVPASEIIHLFLPEWTWQSRGVPWTASSLSRLHMLTSYEDAEVAAANASARKLGFYKRNADAPPVNEAVADTPQVQDIGLAEFEVLPEYYDFVGYDPQHPSTAFGDFVKSTLRSVATGWGVSYNTVANDLEGVNYSSLRQGALNERDLWMVLQDWFVDAFCQRVFNAWINYQTNARGMFEGLSPQLRKEAARCTWQPRRWQWVDPLKDQNANTEALKSATKTFSGVLREQGLDPQDVWAEYASDINGMRAAGLPIELILQNLFGGNAAQNGKQNDGNNQD